MLMLVIYPNRAIPYVLITNGGGVPDEDRRKALSSELGHEVGSGTFRAKVFECR